MLYEVITRFRDEQSVFRLVRQALLDALEATGPALYADAGRDMPASSSAAEGVPSWRPRTPSELGVASAHGVITSYSIHYTKLYDIQSKRILWN